MSALFVKGKIVGKIIRNVKPKTGNPFDVAKYFVVNGDEGAPTELRSYNTGRKSGQEIECPVYVKAWRGQNNFGANIIELDEKDAGSGARKGKGI